MFVRIKDVMDDDLYGDDDLALSMSGFEITDRLRGLAQRIRSVDDWRDVSGVDELLQNDQVLFADLCQEREYTLAHEPG